MTFHISRPPARRYPIAGVLLAVLLAVVGALLAAPQAHAEAPLGPPRHVKCPVPTEEPMRYLGRHLPFFCSSAVADPNGLVVILREGRAAADGPGPFGVRHAVVDRGISEDVIARVVSNVVPMNGKQRRLHYVAKLGEVEVWVVVDRERSLQSPDTRPLGVITAFCRGADGARLACPEEVGGTGPTTSSTSR